MIDPSSIIAYMAGTCIGELLIYIFTKKKLTVFEMINDTFSTVGLICFLRAIITLLVR